MQKAIYVCLDSLGNKLTIKLPITTEVNQIKQMASTKYSRTILKVLDEQRCPDTSQIGKVNVNGEVPDGRHYKVSRIGAERYSRKSCELGSSKLIVCHSYFDELAIDY